MRRRRFQTFATLSGKAAQILTATFIIFALIGGTAWAQFNWVTANQGTFQWDAVTQDSEGDPFPAGTHVEYRSYYVNSLADPNKDSPILVEQTTLTQSTVTFPGKGRFWVGVDAVLVDDGSGELLKESVKNWSDVPEHCLNGETFGFQIFADILAPPNMRIPTP